MSDKIAYKLVNYSKNEELLKEIPHVRLLDLAIIFYCVLKNEVFEFASILIYYSHLKLWKVTVEEMLVYARNNTPRLLPGTFQSMDHVMQDIATSEAGKNPVKSASKWYRQSKKFYLRNIHEGYPL